MILKFNSKKTRMLKQINSALNIFFHTAKDGSQLDFISIKEVLIIDPNMIGDMVMLEPLLRIIKNNIPNCKITLVCSKWAKDILKNEQLVDEYIFVTKAMFTNPWTNKLYRKLFKDSLDVVNKKKYDIALEPRGDLRYIYYLSKCNAKRKISYNYTGGECFLTDVVYPGQDIEHLIDDKIYFLKQLGFAFKEDDKYPRLHLTDDQKKANDKFINEHISIGEIIVGIHPGASLEIKQWKGYSELVKKIAQSYNNIFLLLFEGPGEERAVNDVENAAIEAGVKYIRSKTDMADYMRLLALCDVVLCNDSGAGHIAAAYDDKVITIFGPVIPSLARPYGKSVYAISNDSFDCKPCVSSECYRNCECIESINVDEVFNVFQECMKTNCMKIKL